MPILNIQRYLASHAAIPLTLKAVALLWLLPVLLTLVNASASAILAATSAAFAVCALAQLLNPSTFLIILPFIALLSPMTGLIGLGGASLLYSDLLFPLLAVQAIVIAITRPIQRISKLLSALAFMSLLAIFVGVATDWLTWFKPVVYYLQMFLVAFFTLRAVKDNEDLAALRNAWITAAAMGSVILLKAYVEGRSLIIIQDAVLGIVIKPTDLFDLFRSSYYYTNFHYILGLCIVWTVTRLLFPSTNAQRLWALAALSIFMLALISSANKTALISAVFAFFVTVVVLLHRFRRRMITAMAGIALTASIVLVSAVWLLAQFVGYQVDLIGSRLISTSSFAIRLEVFNQALNSWLSSPPNLLFGYGLSMLEDSGNSSVSQFFKTSAATGYAEGALDSAWLSYLIELGLPGALLLAALFSRGILKSLRGLRSSTRFDEFAFAEASLFGGLVFLVIAMFTQMIGYSKISWLPLQLLVVSAIGLRRDPA